MLHSYHYYILAAAGLVGNINALPLNINLGAYSPALVVGDGEISFGGNSDVNSLMNVLEGAAVNAAAGVANGQQPPAAQAAAVQQTSDKPQPVIINPAPTAKGQPLTSDQQEVRFPWGLTALVMPKASTGRVMLTRSGPADCVLPRHRRQADRTPRRARRHGQDRRQDGEARPLGLRPRAALRRGRPRQGPQGPARYRRRGLRRRHHCRQQPAGRRAARSRHRGGRCCRRRRRGRGRRCRAGFAEGEEGRRGAAAAAAAEAEGQGYDHVCSVWNSGW